MIQGSRLRDLINKSGLTLEAIARRAGTSQSSLSHQMVRGCSEKYYQRILEAIEMKDSPVVRITMEGVDGYVEITRAVMDALCFTTTDHQQYANENYTDGSKKQADDIENGIRAILGYMWPENE